MKAAKKIIKKPKGKKASAPVVDISKEIARAAAQACHDKKGKDIVVLDLQKLSSFADYFVIASGTSDRQVKAICDHVEGQLKALRHPPLSIEGYQEGHWALLDLGNVVVHIFNTEIRDHYALEEFWKRAKRVRFSLK